MIGLATASIHPDLSGGEQLLFQELARRTACRIVIWDDPRETWRECERIIVRCTWDYSWRLTEFLKWIDDVERAGIRLDNAPDVLRWNIDKRYLRDLQARGCELPETSWIPRGTLTAESLAALVTKPCVIKPCVSAGAYNTLRVAPETVGEVCAQLQDVAREKDLLVQEYMPEIAAPGEYSLIFLRNEYSHAVLKTPAAGDFRVQPRYGGAQTGVEVADDVIRQARDVLERIPFAEAPLYARVDGVLRDGRFVLMELELIEPYLFWEHSNGSVTGLAASL